MKPTPDEYTTAVALADEVAAPYELDALAARLNEIMRRWEPGAPLDAGDAAAVLSATAAYAAAASTLRTELAAAHLSRLVQRRRARLYADALPPHTPPTI